MRRITIISLLFVSSYLSAQNTTFSVLAQWTGDLGTSITAAQNLCTAGWATCYIHIESVFHKIAGESLPSPCGKCVWIDDRIQAPTGTTAGTLAAGDDSRFSGGSMTWPGTPGITICTGTPCSAWGTSLTAPSGTIVGTSDSQALTNKDISGAGNTFPNFPESQITNLVTDLSGKVGTGTTVNGHALSSNVTVSASDLTTGTLPHAQLPTLVSGDIPSNAANTSGNAATATALASAPTQCSAGNAPLGIAANGNAQNCTTITGGGQSVAYLSADTAGSTTNTLVTTGMTFSIAANTKYTLDCNLFFTSSTTSGVGLTLGVNGPGSPTEVSLMRQINTTATAFRVDSSQGASWAAKIGATATTVTALSLAHLYGLIENGSTAGTLDIQYANIGTTGTTVVKRGSWCKLQ